MEINKKTKKQLITNLNKWKKRTSKYINNAIIDIKNCNTDVEELMELKGALLSTILESLPLTIDECYFCIHNLNDNLHVDCSECSYGKYNGKCQSYSSNFSKLFERSRALKNDFKQKYPIFYE